MPLPDFIEFKAFNSLRKKMGTDSLGFFELFDPIHHLTGVDRSNLNRHGLDVPSSQLSCLLDFTLIFKNSRVVAIDSNCYHISNCSSFPKTDYYHIATSLQSVSVDLPVCKDCLQKLQYRGYDSHKARKEAYSMQVYERFSLNEFWRQHYLYPVSEKRDIRKVLGS